MGTRGLGCVWISGLRILAIGTDWDQRCGSIDGAKCLTPCLRKHLSIWPTQVCAYRIHLDTIDRPAYFKD